MKIGEEIQLRYQNENYSLKKDGINLNKSTSHTVSYYSSSITSLQETPQEESCSLLRKIFCCCKPNEEDILKRETEKAAVALGLFSQSNTKFKNSRSFDVAKTSAFDNHVTMKLHECLKKYKQDIDEKTFKNIMLIINHEPTISEVNALDLTINNLLEIDQILKLLDHCFLLQILRLPRQYEQDLQSQVIERLITLSHPIIYCLGMNRAHIIGTKDRSNIQLNPLFRNFLISNPLRGLEFNNCSDITDKHLEIVNSVSQDIYNETGKCHLNLRYLNVENAALLNGDGLVSLLENQKNIVILNLDGCSNISKFSHKKIASLLSPKLQYLGLNNAKHLNFEILKLYLMNKPKLKGLDISGFELTNNELKQLANMMPFVETLNLTGCKLKANSEDLRQSRTNINQENTRLTVPTGLVYLAMKCTELLHLGFSDISFIIEGKDPRSVRNSMQQFFLHSSKLQYLSINIPEADKLIEELPDDLPQTIKQIDVGNIKNKDLNKMWKSIDISDSSPVETLNPVKGDDEYTFKNIALRHAYDLWETSSDV
ncbi:MAG: hypothetical protein JHC93_03325 [Parachlamydiales bacterium]|nr:hypothetical protein [Parachlamydiales bacterium]